MKFKNFYVDCNTETQINIVANIAKSNGYKEIRREDLNESIIGFYENGNFQYLPNNCRYGKTLNFDEFVSKYGKQNEMVELINKARSELKMNDSELSLALGKSRQYIGKMLRLPQSKKVQDKVIKEINALLTRDKFGKLSIGNHTHMSIENVEVNGGEIFVTETIQDPKDKQISDLKKANEQQKLVIDKLDDQLIKAEKIHNEDVKTIDLKDKEINYLNKRRIEYKKSSIEKQKMIDELTDALQWEQKEFNKTRDELEEVKSSHNTSKALNWFFVVAIILAAIVWKAYNG